jgi:O-antigen/teichoic acid export membrane protein
MTRLSSYRSALSRFGRDNVAHTAVAVFGAQVSAYIVGLAASVIIARALGPSGRGAYYLPVAAATTAVAVAHLSIETTNAYFFAERGTSIERLSRSAAFLIAILAGPLIGAMLLIYAALGDSLLAGVSLGNYAIAVATIPFSMHILWMANLFLLAKRVTWSQGAVFVGAVAQAAGLLIAYAAGGLTVRIVLVFYALSVLVPWALLVALGRRFAPAWPRGDVALLRTLVPFSLRLHAGMISIFLLLRSDVFLVNAFLDRSAVGVYSLAVIFAELIWLVTNSLVVAVLPFQAAADRVEAGRLSFKAARFNAAVALIIAGAMVATMWVLLPVVYGEDFSGAYAPFVALLPGVVVMAAARPLSNWLIRDGRPLVYSVLAATAFILNIVLNLILIPAIGIVGASAASSLAYLALAAAQVTWALRLAGLRLSETFLPQPGDRDSLQRFVRLTPRGGP